MGTSIRLHNYYNYSKHVTNNLLLMYINNSTTRLLFGCHLDIL